jgi:carbonic anhydrase
MDRLIEGFRNFRENLWPENRALFRSLANRGQAPKVMVIACADSRVDPQLIFSAAPGEIFTVRNVANLVPPYAPNSDYHGTSAALEFAVRALEVEHIVVLGHADCGGVRALLRGPNSLAASDFVDSWMSIAAPARERALAKAGGNAEAAQHVCEHETVKVSLDNLLTFPWIRERVAGGKLQLHGCYFGIESGQLLLLDESGEFRPAG